MRLARLALAPYGAYREESALALDSSKCFHIVYGLNESGKTTRRAAIVDLLFGFEHRTEYAFAYEMNALRILACVEFGGTLHEVERRKGRADTLRDAAGAPIADEVVRAWLGGVDRQAFLMRFSFGAGELRKGADLLLSSGGNLGYSLYGAALGGTDARTVLAELEREANDLFKPRGQTMLINAAVSRHSQLSKSLRENVHPPDVLRVLEEKGAHIAERLRNVGAEQGALQQRMARVEAIVSVITEHERYRELRRVIEEAQGRERVPDETLDELQAAVERARELEQRERAAREARERISRDPLTVDANILRFGVEIDALAAELGSLQKILAEVREARVEECARSNGERYRALRDRYWPGVEEAVLLERKPHRKAIEEIRKLANERAALVAAQAEAERACEKELREQARLDEAFAALQAPADTLALESVLEAARALGDVDELLARSDAGMRARREALDKRALALRFVAGGAAQLAQRKLPLPQEIARFAKREQELQAAQAALRERRTRACDALAAAERIVEQHEAAGELGIVERLEAARRKREECFVAVESAWQTGAVYDVQMPERYRAAADGADRVADERYERAEAVARADRAVADRNVLRLDLQRIDTEIQAASEVRGTFEAAWKASWEVTEIVPDVPEIMGEWLTRANVLLAEHLSLEEKDAECVELRARRTERHTSLCRELQRLGHSDAADTQRDLAALTARGAGLLERARAEHVKREHLRTQRERTRSALDAAVQARERTGRQAEQWSARWQQALTGLFLPTETSPEAIDAILEDLTDLFEAYTGHRSDSALVERARIEEERYRKRGVDVIAAAAPDLQRTFEQLMPEAVKDLRARLKLARDNAARLAEREEQTKRAQAQLDEVEMEAREACARRDALLQILDVSLDGIDARIQAALEVRRLRKEGEDADRELRLGARCSVAEIDAEAERLGYEGLRAELLSLRDKLREFQDEREALIGERQKLTSEREELDSSDAAVQTQGELLAVAGEIDRYARRYAALLLARTLLEEEVNRYALTHQAPILLTASRYLSLLTCDRYSHVRVVGEGDAQTIEVVCASGDRAVEALSDGTRDQLYLALRLAVLEEHLQAGQPLPLIVDDALLTFDDKRTGAALAAFGEFAHKTQVIYFTHHERVLDIAEEVLGAQADLVRIGEGAVSQQGP